MTNKQDQAALAGPLAGVRVIDLSAVLMGPYATQIFGDHGADVIKIESPEGDSTRWIGPGRHPGMGPLFLHLNRNKRSVALDLKSPQGAAAMRHLIEGADVFVHNLRPASIERLGLDYERVSAINPRIIWCGVYGYGEDGPYAGRPAYDDLIQGAVGIAALQQCSGASEPRYVPLTIADRMVGLHAAHSVAMALYGRERTGRGCRIDVPAVPLNTIESLLDDPHLAAVGFFQQVEHPSEGAMRTFGAPARWVGYDVSKLAPAPRLGEHTESVLRECGFDASALASLLASGAAVSEAAGAEVSA